MKDGDILNMPNATVDVKDVIHQLIQIAMNVMLVLN